MRLNPMDVFVIICVLVACFVVLWLAIDYIRMVIRHKKWERELDEDAYTIE